MPRHTRRSFAASAMVLAGLGDGPATPTAGVDPATILTAYIEYIWNGIDNTRLVDLFDSDAWDLEEEQRQHQIWRDALSDTPSPVMVRDIMENERSAVAYCTMIMANGEQYAGFIMITLNDSGLINFYRWMAQLE